MYFQKDKKILYKFFLKKIGNFMHYIYRITFKKGYAFI